MLCYALLSQVQWNHATCFTLPKRLLPEEFFATLEVSPDVSQTQLAELRTLLNGEDDDGSTPGGKRASGASEGGSNKKAKADITKDMSEAE